MCEHCGMAYSFYFGVQYHKSTCPLIVADKIPVNTVGDIDGAMTKLAEIDKAKREQESFMAMEAKMLGEE